jgi:hypothetical protein
VPDGHDLRMRSLQRTAGGRAHRAAVRDMPAGAHLLEGRSKPPRRSHVLPDLNPSKDRSRGGERTRLGTCIFTASVALAASCGGSVATSADAGALDAPTVDVGRPSSDAAVIPDVASLDVVAPVVDGPDDTSTPPGDACLPLGSGCTQRFQCCSQQCHGAKCVAQNCEADGQPCVAAAQCCSGTCNGQCGAQPGEGGPASCAFGDTTCDQCLSTLCCAQVAACEQDPACLQALQCLVTCEQGGGSGLACAEGQCSKPSDQLTTNLFTCGSINCSTPCYAN